MIVIDELRRLLDEKGVEWDYGITGATSTKFSANGIDVTFVQSRDGLVCSTILTPEQVIEVTLGDDRCEWVLEYSNALYDKWRCSKCGYPHIEPRSCDQDNTKLNLKPLCPGCGRRVKQ